MKRKISFGIAVLMILATCLLVSCNSDVSTAAQANDGKLVYATFDNSGSKGTTKPTSGSTAVITYDTVDIDTVYWVYTATKNDQGGTTGKGSHPVAIIEGNPAKGLTGTIGPFSAGSWTFEIGGYKEYTTDQPEGDYVTATYTHGSDVKTVYYEESNKVFYGTNFAVSLVSGTESQPAPIVINIELSPEGTGTIELKSDFGFFWLEDPAAEATGVPRMEMLIDGIGSTKTLLLEKVSGNIYYTLKADQDLVWENVDAGSYVLTVTIRYTNDVNTNDPVYYTVSVFENINVKVYSGLTTTIDATMIEGNTVYATLIPGSMASVATATNVVNDKSTTFASSFSPASPSSSSTTGAQDTTVTFPAGSLAPTGTGTEDITEYILTTKVSDLETVQDRGFFVTEGSSAAGSIDLSLKKVVNNVTTPASFTGNVRIVTYIATNLLDVDVHYDGTGDAPTDVEYDPTTGRLSFVTTHFSEYYVTTTSEAYNSNKVKAYDTLRSALDDADPNDTIVLLKDADLGTPYDFAKSITLLGQGYQVRASSSTGGYSSGNEGRVFNITDVSDIDVTLVNLRIKGEDNAVRGISLYNTSNVNLTLSGCNVWANYYAINIASANTDLHVTLKDTTTSTGWCAIQSHSSGAIFDITGGTLEGINDKPYNDEGWNNFSTIVINQLAENNTWNITDCTIKASQTTGNRQTFLSFRTTGSTVTCTNCTFILDGVDITDDLQVVVDNLSFTSWDAVHHTHLVINGELILDPSMYVTD